MNDFIAKLLARCIDQWASSNWFLVRLVISDKIKVLSRPSFRAYILEKLPKNILLRKLRPIVSFAAIIHNLFHSCGVLAYINLYIVVVLVRVDAHNWKQFFLQLLDNVLLL